jgi:hypothetical protein
MKIIIVVGVIISILVSSCSSEDNKSVEDIQEVEVSNNFLEKSKRGKERFVVMGEYNYVSYLAHKNASMRMYSRMILDVDTEVVEFRLQNEYGSNDTSQFIIEELIDSDDLYESYKITELEGSSQPITLVLLENGLVLGPYPVVLPHESWQMYYDVEKADQAYTDLNYYLDKIEDLSFEVK